MKEIILLENKRLAMSKWFCDNSTGAATGAARCGSFVGGGFGLLVAIYE
jgi:hypothetical protein